MTMPPVALPDDSGRLAMAHIVICRLLVGADQRILAPAAILFGGGFLVTCETVARTVIAPTELPVGIITALLGSPFFLWLLLSNRQLT
ncbi:MAG: iron chelate uptake ABC transporter family permease subunit [Thermoguttaceae bacterium]|jgi:iron complex transport system permease protein|nr:iron chelate uptake ABC transporter family permease subunit [Thermoguttaceae bacterium]